ncbi:hypothetical protein BDZ90DRAFT_234734 [Jaminaea rosea]|uniref:Uncharacterized protein n=1 Tax=Jaminaea rosea TaxID=1569628 RepID=A0A316ULI2_9BASI|nr:hypothetical protein BDZ90DRAFT_234734 [Jaminaea rosea]PWN24783.1 hypothetical protein BDZ90DRAFT_234734 [Jaminaea rosea]
MIVSPAALVTSVALLLSSRVAADDKIELGLCYPSADCFTGQTITVYGKKNDTQTPIGSLSYCKGFQVDPDVGKQVWACQGGCGVQCNRADNGVCTKLNPGSSAAARFTCIVHVGPGPAAVRGATVGDA